MRFHRVESTGRGSWMTGIRRELSEGQWEDIFLARKVPSEPLELEAEDGKRLPDLLLTSGWVVCISQRMLEILEAVSATGYSAFPVVLTYPVVRCTIAGYHGLAVTGRRDFKTGEWDGTDVHVMEGYGFNTWVTERVAMALKKAKPKLRNVVLTPTTEQPERQQRIRNRRPKG